MYFILLNLFNGNNYPQAGNTGGSPLGFLPEMCYDNGLMNNFGGSIFGGNDIPLVALDGFYRQSNQSVPVYAPINYSSAPQQIPLQIYQQPNNSVCGKTRSSETGNRLLKAAISCSKEAKEGFCLGGVANAVKKVMGVSIGADSAFQAQYLLEKSDKFTEIKGIKREDLACLPAGAIVVWDPISGKPHGHIGVADGNGNEWSCNDEAIPQKAPEGRKFRVFVPNDMVV